jgi:hypothetical protein
MVTESQTRQAAPLVTQIDSLNALVAQINANDGNWKPAYVIFMDGHGLAQNLNLTALPAPDLLNSIFQLAQSTLTTLENELAAI